MQHMVHSIEIQDSTSNTTAAALIRSAFEDIQLMRREHLAGDHKALLKKRPDDIAPQLLTRSEEEKKAGSRALATQKKQDTNGSKGTGKWAYPQYLADEQDHVQTKSSCGAPVTGVTPEHRAITPGGKPKPAASYCSPASLNPSTASKSNTTL